MTEKVAMLIEQLAGKESENIRLKKEVERLTVLLIARNALAGGLVAEAEVERLTAKVYELENGKLEDYAKPTGKAKVTKKEKADE